MAAKEIFHLNICSFISRPNGAQCIPQHVVRLLLALFCYVHSMFMVTGVLIESLLYGMLVPSRNNRIRHRNTHKILGFHR